MAFGGRASALLTLVTTAVVLALSAVPATASPWALISHANDRGVHRADGGFDTAAGQPTEMELRVRVVPDKKIEVRYQVACKGPDRGQWGKTINRTLTTRSTIIDLPINIANPKFCGVYAFGTYENDRFDRRVAFRIALWAKADEQRFQRDPHGTRG